MGFDVEESQQQWRETWTHDVRIGNVGNDVLFENERICVWHLEVAPGESSPLHTHMNPYFSVILNSTRLRTKFPDGQTSIDEDPVGAVIWFGLEDARRTHTLENIGTQPCVARVVELLSPP